MFRNSLFRNRKIIDFYALGLLNTLRFNVFSIRLTAYYYVYLQQKDLIY